MQSKHTHVVQWPGGDRADKRNRNVIIALLEVTLRKASGPPLPQLVMFLPGCVSSES